MELAFGIIVGLIILVILVVVHEFGHAVASRRNGVVVEEFGIGFPPRAWGKKLKNGVLFSLNWLPLGGFVKLQGEHDAADKKGDYGAATFWQKTKILFAGVFVNWIVAVIILSVLAVTGLPKVLPDQFSIAGDSVTVTQPVEIASVLTDYPAAQAGFEPGDKIIQFAGSNIETASQLASVAKDNAGETVDVVYEREGERSKKQVELKADQNDSVFGAGLAQREFITSTWSAPIVGVVTTAQFTWVTFQGIGELLANLFTGVFFQLSPDPAIRDQANADLEKVSSSVAGPVGILGVIFPAAEQAGLTQLLFLTAIISLTLAVMNALPIPALDGGRWFVTAVFKLIKKPLTKEREEKIQATGFLILMSLIILITIGDVAKFF
jgi:regulator of sigma E protease